MTDFNFGVDQIRIILHLLGVTVWLGGQIVMLGLLPVLRQAGGDVPKLVARGFHSIAWPAFGLAVVTGIWNMLDVDMGEATTGYNMAFGIKMLLVVITGLAAGLHQTTEKPAVRGITGALGFIAALGAFVLGIGMGH